MKRILTFSNENADIAKVTLVFSKKEYYEFAAEMENLYNHFKTDNKISNQEYKEYLEKLIKGINIFESEWV